MTTQNSYFADDNFLDLLASYIVKDRVFLRENFPLLDAKDFEPFDGSVTGNHRWVVVTKALEHYEKFMDPIGQMLTGSVRQHIKYARMGERQSDALLEYAAKRTRTKLPPPGAIVQQLREFKAGQQKHSAMNKLLQLQASGELTDEKWLQICREAIDIVEGTQFQATDFGDPKQLENRIHRRTHGNNSRYPLLLIDPFDSLVKAISRGQLGLVLAPYKRGKSRLLIWIALAYMLQGLNVLYFTLEDPKDETEDRFDAAATGLILNNLSEHESRLRKRWQHYISLCRGRVKIVDGTDGMTLNQMENIILRERENGFTADACIVDYDEEVIPPKTHKDRRFEFADIYRGKRRLAAKYQLLWWTAAQTQRNTENLKIINGDKASEDIGKIRKAFCAIGVGRGDWGPESQYLFVAAHKNDKQHVGCNIMTDPARMLAYDRERTLKQIKLDVAADKSGKKRATSEVEEEEAFVEV